MDPQETWKQLADAYEQRDYEDCTELAAALKLWLERGGFPPRITGRDDFDRAVATAVCEKVGPWAVQHRALHVLKRFGM